MKAFTVILVAGLCALACGYSVPTKQSIVADKEFLSKQSRMFELLQNVNQQSHILPHLFEKSTKFNFADHFEKFDNVEAVKKFVQMLQTDVLISKDEVFSIYNEYHREQAIALFNVFYYAKDFEMFYDTLVWARFNINPGMFVYSMTVALLHRKDLPGLELPAPYEIEPYYFFNTETIQKAHISKMQGFHGYKKVEGVYNSIIQSNYTGSFYKTNLEQKLSYFTEDIGLNTYYYYFHADYPFWMGGKEFNLYKDRRGEFYLYLHQQFLARYYMERLSNDLGEIPEFSFYEPIETGYSPALRYYNGIFFPQRENFYHAYNEYNYYDVKMVDDYERRIRDAISHGFIVMPDGKHVDLTKPESVEYLGNLIEGNGDSVNNRFYGYFSVLAKTLLGSSFHNDEYDNSYIPGVLEHFETAMRDPMFYQLYKRVIRWYWEFKEQLPTYTRNQIEFTGVKVESVEMDKLVTYFDKHDADITNAVDIEYFNVEEYKQASDFQKFGKIAHYNGEELVVKARQTRLNHLPFTFKLTVDSAKAVPSVVRVYMAPKYDQYGFNFTLNENRENFFLLDRFKYDLVAGKNVIVRASQDYTWYIHDRTSYYDLYKWVMTASKGETKFTLDMTEAHSGLPNRLMLPKGKKGGMPFQFFFIVSPYHAPAVEQFTGFNPIINSGVGSGAKYVDSLPFGYPFDRKIDPTVWYTDNMFYYDVNIFHKKENDINSVQH